MNANILRIPCELRFKGDRRYLQGGDIYEAVCGALNRAAGGLDNPGELTFHRFATRQCDVYLTQDENAVMPEDRVCDGIYRTSSGEWRLWLEETGRPVLENYAFDEQSICDASLISHEKSIRLERETGFSAIEIAVALTKHLHNTLFPLERQRWIFTKFEFARLLRPSDAARISVRLLMNLHNRITKSELCSGEEVVGYIYFSAVPK